MISEKSIQTGKGEIKLFTLTNSLNHSVVLSNLGAGIIELNVPDRDGKLADVALGYANVEDYFYDGPCAGKCPGRYANRIAKGKFSIDGVEYFLPVNNGPNHLHGGPEGFQNQLWKVIDKNDNSVEFQYESKDGEEGYPGYLTVNAKYIWTDSDELKLTLTAKVEGKPTILNLTNHAYWNLRGHDSGNVLDQSLQINASKYLPTDDTLIPLGTFESVKNTPMDFISSHPVKDMINEEFPALKYGKGYDNCWIVDDYKDGKIKEVAVLSDSTTGRRLTVESDQPGIQVYTGNWLEGSPVNKAGRSYNDYDGIAIECQNFPDAPNRAEFPSAILKPGELYKKNIFFKFSTF